MKSISGVVRDKTSLIKRRGIQRSFAIMNGKLQKLDFIQIHKSKSTVFYRFTK